MKMPEDYENGVQGMIDDTKPYPELTPLAQRSATEVKLKTNNGVSDEELYKQYSFSAGIMQVANITKKLYGFMRDGNVQDRLEQIAIRSTNALNDLIMDAPCLNRDGRYAVEEKKAQQWLKLIEQDIQRPVVNDAGEEEPAPDHRRQLYDLLNRWSAADAFMLQARLIEEQHGLDAAEHLYEEYAAKAQQLEDIRMEASQLPANYNMLYMCRVRQFEIMRERTYDLAMGYPNNDLTDVKRQLVEGGDIHDLVPMMPWPFKESYNQLMSSMMDGDAHRTLWMSLTAGQLPAQQPPWPMGPQGFWPGMANGQPQNGENGDEGPPDQRRALFNFGGNRQQAQEPPKGNHIRRRRSRRDRGQR